MPRFSNSEKTDMILALGECHGNSREAQHLYSTRYPDRHQPSHETIRKLEASLRQHGSFVSKSRAPRKDRIVGNEEREQDVLALVQQDPKVSSRVISDQTGHSQMTVLRILHRHKFHPFKIHLHQALVESDTHRRIEFSLNMKEKMQDDPTFLKSVLWSDECTFHRNGFVNRHNMHYWSVDNPHWLGYDYYQVRWKINVWAGILGNRVIGPFFFNDNLNGETYLEFLQGDLANALDDLPLQLTRNMWFQQDGAPPHYKVRVRHWLNREYGDHWIGRGAPFPWPSRSPDLTPLDFFLWGYVKNLVYVTEPENVDDLKERIVLAIRTITPGMLTRVRRSIKERFDNCLAEDGGHFEHLL